MVFYVSSTLKELLAVLFSYYWPIVLPVTAS